LDNNKLYFSKNGVFQNSGVPTSGATGTGAISQCNFRINMGYLFGVTKDNESSETAQMQLRQPSIYYLIR
jgi:hypothetical protein